MFLLSKGGLKVTIKAERMHLSALQRGLCSVWASRNTHRNRRVGNYCENCAQEVKPTEFPKEPLLPTIQSSPCGQSGGFRILCSLTQMQRLEPQSERVQPPGVKCVLRLPCSVVASGQLTLSPPNPAGTSWHNPPAGLGLGTPLFYNPTPQAHNPPSFHLIIPQT